MSDESAIIVESRDRVGVIRLNRPQALNAINRRMIGELDAALSAMSQDREVGCVLLKGSEKAFAAGADLREMQGYNFVEAYLDDFLARWDSVAGFRKPIVAAVSGFALGGGCELALMCDIILAADTAQFGQPEIKLALMPGAGGTQRLTRAIGKAKAMDLCLTGRTMGAEEAERSGLVSRIIPAAQLEEEAMRTASTIAAMSLPATMMVKESVNRAFDTPLTEGMRGERRQFYSTFATRDQKEGMAAFLEKRRPTFENR